MADPAAQLPAIDVSPETQAELEKKRAAATAQRLIAEINASERAQQKWLTRARKIIRKYKKEGSETSTKRQFALLWSNTETIEPAVYSRPPEPVVMRRFGDPDPVGRVVSEVLERSLKYSIDKQDFDGTLGATAKDFVLIARAQVWERYVPTFGPQVTPEIPLQLTTDATSGEDEARYADPDGAMVDPAKVLTREDGQAYMLGEPYREVTYEESVTDYVNFEDFGHSVGRTWDEVDIVWRRTYLGRKALVERFGEELGRKIPLDWGGAKDKPRSVEDDVTKKAAVYEAWVKSEKKAYWISKAYSDAPLDARDDPLQLEGFFPCPRPLLGTTANDSLLPTPDYVFYQDQAEEIDDLTDKITELQKALKVVGLYAGDKGSTVATLVAKANNTLVPVPDWLSLKETGGIRGAVEWWPIDMVVTALEAMIAQRQLLINDVYQITGISDILRGMNDPRATAMAEGIKTQWGTLRVRDRQKEMQRFARDALAIKGQVIAEKFGLDTLKAMTQLQLPTRAEKQALQAQLQQQAMQAQLAAQQQARTQMAGPMPGGPTQAAPPQAPPQPTPEQEKVLSTPSWEDVMERLRDNALRCFSIDIETDSTIEPNEQEEKAKAIEFTQAIGQMVAQWGPAIQAQPGLAEMAAEFMKWGARKFRAGRQMEDVIERTMAKLGQSLAQGGGQAGQAEAQAKAADGQVRLQEVAMKQQTDMAKIEVQRADDQAQQQLQAADLGIRAEELELKRQAQALEAVAMYRDPDPQVVQ